MITVSHLKKTFRRNKVEAVKDVSMEIRDGQIFALLGPNGAGKTTTMRMLSTLLLPTSGSICYDDVPLAEDTEAIRRYETFSTGMKQKTSIAICLLHDPDTIIFDEPTNGLDILTQNLIEEYMLKLKKEGKCIILSTHILDLARRLSDRVGVIVDGKSVYVGEMAELASSQGVSTMEEAFLNLYKENHEEKAIVGKHKE